MGVVTFEMELQIPPARMFKAFVLDDPLIPVLLPQTIKDVVAVWKAMAIPAPPLKASASGSSKFARFAHFNRFALASRQFNSVKHRVDELGKEKLKFAYTIVEGDALMKELEKISDEINFEAGLDSGCVCKSKYYATEQGRDHGGADQGRRREGHRNVQGH
ncbi:major strawberry allergen Fra a 1.06-like [Syzygium oleosum]|uniref:major strawberry allergen Fra a 1.06-like n=1 Tax=Syzygium oleosum TaxID=219896 RepID=UPI0024BA1B87|nr:major strawberry allergen Fra a 1.06-like [Syzygium oleosum]